MESTSAHDGGCLCGSLRFRTHGMPSRTVACHCSFCQRMTGSSFSAESAFAADAVEMLKGTPAQYAHRSDGSGKLVYVHFCSTCGTTIGLTFERWPGVRAVSRGAFDDPNWVRVDANIWTRSAQEDIALPAGIDCFAMARLTLDGTPQTASRHDTPTMARTSKA